MEDDNDKISGGWGFAEAFNKGHAPAVRFIEWLAPIIVKAFCVVQF